MIPGTFGHLITSKKDIDEHPILGGAIGNIIDRLFYAIIFDYGAFFQGRVVDFIHVNLWSGSAPESLPLIGGTYMALFPIFNVADIAIVSGVIGILIFQKKFHQQLVEAEQAAVPTPSDVSANGILATAPAVVTPTMTPPPVSEDRPAE